MQENQNQKNQNLGTCCYNKNHKVKKNKLYSHEQNCPDKKFSNLVQCQYDFNHKVKRSELDKHHRNCPNKPNLEEDVQREMLEFARKNAALRETKKLQDNFTVKNVKKTKLPPGLGYLKKKEENKEFKKDICKLSKILDEQDEKNDEDCDRNYKDYLVDDEFDRELNKKEELEADDFYSFGFKENKEKSFDDSYVDVGNAEDRKNREDSNKKSWKINSDSEDNDNYDPNLSDEFIDEYNKNNRSYCSDDYVTNI